MTFPLAEVIERRNFVVLDTETTGLERPAEICQIAVLRPDGSPLFDALVKPKHGIPPAATLIHGIANEDVEDSPSWPDIRPAILDAINGKDVIVYNAKYDRMLMHWSDEESDGELVNYKASATWYCAMLAYAEFHGERHPYYGTYVWQRLAVACDQMGVKLIKSHSAFDDALNTLRLCYACMDLNPRLEGLIAD